MQGKHALNSLIEDRMSEQRRDELGGTVVRDITAI